MKPVIIWVCVFILKDVRTNREHQRDCWMIIHFQGIEQPRQQRKHVSISLCLRLALLFFFLLMALVLRERCCSSQWLVFLFPACVCVCKSRTEAQPCPSITMTYWGQICWHHVFAGLCICVCVQRRGRGGQIPPKITWKKRDNPFFGIFLPSLDWELVKNLHLWEDTRNKTCKWQL